MSAEDYLALIKSLIVTNQSKKIQKEKGKGIKDRLRRKKP